MAEKRTLVAIVTLCLVGMTARAVDLESVPHRIIDDNRTFLRDLTDRRYSVWTGDPAAAKELITTFGIRQEEIFTLPKGEIFAIFLNDRIEEDLVQITHNKTANEIFADYADSGIRFKLKTPETGKKYSHLTAVVFSPPAMPNHLGLRGMIVEGLSEKK